ncbi:MAG: repressor LexA [Planctomycetes bacterium]|nr:repressor LexA [Planctomycetota bacterium]
MAPRDREIFRAIVDACRDGEPPTVREIGRRVGLRSPSTVIRHLRALAREGLIEITGRSRGVRVLRGLGIPVVGTIAAGAPIETWPEPSGELRLDPRLFESSGDVVALRVVGDSMVEAGILDGDYAIIRRQPEVEDGEIAAVTVDGEGTLKRFCRGPERTVRLVAANRRFPPIHVSGNRDLRVFGKYVGLIRGSLPLS